MRTLIADCETTGLLYTRLIPIEKQPEVIEFYGAVVDLDTGEISDEFDTLVKPEKEINEKSQAFRKVGITNDMVKDAPDFRKCAPRIKQLIEGAEVVIAHNCSFDKEMLDIEFEKLGQEIVWPRVLCSVEQTVHLVGRRLKLIELYQRLFNEKFAAHRAKGDVTALIRVCVELRKRGVV